MDGIIDRLGVLIRYLVWIQSRKTNDERCMM